MRGALNAKCIGISVQRLHHALGQRANGFPVVQRTAYDFVVNVGDIAYIGDLVAAGLEPALHHVERQHGTRMTQVTIVIHRHTADVHAHVAGL